MLAYRDVFVCGNCKPILFQKIEQGFDPLTLKGREVAGFLIRALARIIDALITTATNWVFTMLLFLAFGVFTSSENFGSGVPTPAFAILMLLNYALSLGIPCIYETLMLGRYNATLGKMLLGVEVVRADSERLTYWRAFGRYWGTVLSSIICFIGYIMALFDDEARTLHDHLCDTRVVRTEVGV